MKTVIWNLRAGSKVGQETRDIKLAEGEKYIERLKELGEEVEEVIYEQDYIKININEK